MIFQNLRRELNRLHDKLDRLDSRLDKVDVHLATYNEQLSIHIKRTELLENKVDPLAKRVIESRSVTEFLAKSAKFVAWGVSLCGGIAGIVWTLSRIL